MDFNQLVGYTDRGLCGGLYVMELEVEEKHLNQFGYVHGGVLFTLLDTALSRACFEVLPAGRKEGVTLEMKINYLKSISSGRLTAQGKLVNLTKRTAFVEGQILDGNDVLLAKANGTMYMPDPR